MQQINHLLDRIWQDGRIDQNEKQLLKELAAFSRIDELSYMRNRAFDIANEKIQAGLPSAMVLAGLEKIVKLVQSAQLSLYGSHQAAYFSPGEVCRKTIIDLINKAVNRVDICVFTISDNMISQAILAAHQKGILVRVITDNDKSNDLGSDIDSLAKQGVPVVMDRSRHHMHHKFAIIDNHLLNGSFNWTRSASERNQENITVNNSQKLVAIFSVKFNELWDLYS